MTVSHHPGDRLDKACHCCRDHRCALLTFFPLWWSIPCVMTPVLSSLAQAPGSHGASTVSGQRRWEPAVQFASSGNVDDSQGPEAATAKAAPGAQVQVRVAAMCLVVLAYLGFAPAHSSQPRPTDASRARLEPSLTHRRVCFPLPTANAVQRPHFDQGGPQADV
jgi:hypothetical protein